MDDTGELFTFCRLLIYWHIAYFALVVATLDDRAETQRHTLLWITRFYTLGCSTSCPTFWPMTHLDLHLSRPLGPATGAVLCLFIFHEYIALTKETLEKFNRLFLISWLATLYKINSVYKHLIIMRLVLKSILMVVDQPVHVMDISVLSVIITIPLDGIVVLFSL